MPDAIADLLIVGLAGDPLRCEVQLHQSQMYQVAHEDCHQDTLSHFCPRTHYPFYIYLYFKSFEPSDVEFQQALEDRSQLLIRLVSFEFFYLDSERIIMAHGNGIVIDQDHLCSTLGHFLQMLQILVEGSIFLLAAVPVESPLDDSLLVDFIKDCIGVGFISSRIDIDVEDFRNRR